MTLLDLKFLGELSIHQDDVPLTALKSQKGQALLFYLALIGKAYTRSALAGLFWPEMPEVGALMNLRKVLSRLNPHLAPYLTITWQTVTFNQDSAYRLDVTEFEAGAAAKGDIGRLQAAVALYQGDFLEGFTLPDAPQFEEWVLAQRARLREMALSALHTLITHFAAQTKYETAIAYARQLLAVEPWREEAQRELMRLLALFGQRSAALVQYETCRDILAEELGVEPAPATVELYEQIKDNKVTEDHSLTLSLPYRGDQEPTTPSPSHNLPVRSTPLIGRETELARLSQLLAKPDGRLVTIVGIGGIGKTRLALAVAEQQVTTPQRDNIFANGVYFVSLAPLSQADHILPTLAQAIDFQMQPDDQRAPEQQVLDFLRYKHMLLLFDNFEHLLDGTSLIAGILQAAPYIKVVATSREPLRLYEEQVFPLEGLAFSERMATEEDAAVQLFRQRARRMRPDFKLHEADLPHLTTICRQVGGMPLALELAAAWVDSLPLADIARELEQSLDLLETEWRNVPDRHRNMRAVFEASWQRLPDEEQQIFGRMSVFRGGFTRPAAWQVCAPEMSQPAFWHILAALVGKSFLHYDSTSDRYDLHELLRQFAAEKLAQAPEVETVTRDRHSITYCAFLHWHTEHWHTARQLETLAAVTLESANVEQAWGWALAQREWQRLVQAIDSWGWFHDWQGRHADGESFCQAIVEQAERQTAGETATSPDCLRLWASTLAWMNLFTANNRTASSRTKQSLVLLERPELAGQDTRREKAFVLALEGGKGGRLLDHDLQEVRQLIEQSLALYRELGDQWGIAEGLVVLGLLDWHSGNYDSGLTRAQAALAIHQERGDRRAQAGCMTTLGLIHKTLGHLEEAERLERKALSLSRRIGDRSTIVLRHAELAHTLLWQGKFAEAQQLAGESLAICRDLGDRAFEGWAQFCLSETLMHSGQYQPAGRQADSGLLVAKALGDQSDEGALYGVLGQLALVESSYAKAQAAFAKSAELFRETQNSDVVLSLAGLSYTASHLNQPQQACQYLAEALASGLAAKTYMPVVFALPGVALLLAQTGEAARAVELWAMAKCHPLIANSKWFEDVAGRELDDLAATLPPAVAAAAWQRGQRLELWQTAEALLAELEATV